MVSSGPPELPSSFRNDYRLPSATMRIKLTLANIRTRCLPPRDDDETASGKSRRQREYWDTEFRGLGLVVRKPRGPGDVNATFVLQRTLGRGAGRRTRKAKIGRFGPWTIEMARKRAAELTVAFDRGEDPEQERAQSLTLREALDIQIANMKARRRTPRSLQTIRTETEKYLGRERWLDRPLIGITREQCRALHQRITTNNGPYIANRILRHLRTIWNAAARVYEELPQTPPTCAITWNEELRSEKRVEWKDLPEWWAKVQAIQNPVRRDLQVFILLTGLRSTDAKTVRWEDVDLEKGTIHRPEPKGGKKRAFTVPLAKYVVEMLKARRAQNAVIFGDDRGWVFPAIRSKGKVSHVREVKEQRNARGEKGWKKVSYLPGPHALRHTFATAGYEALLRELDLKVLMNHAAPKGDVTRGYVHVGEDHLRMCIERVVGFLLEKAGVVGAGEKRDVG